MNPIMRYIKWMPMVLIFFLLISTGGLFAADKKIKLRVASPWPPALMTVKTTLKWEEKVTKATNGRITFQNLWLGTLCKAQECVQTGQKGLADVIGSTWLYYPKSMPLNQFSYAVPFGPDDPRIMLKVGRELWKKYPQLREEIEKNNLVVLRTYVAMSYNIVSRKPIREPSDMKNMKICAGGIFLPKWVTAAGAATTAIPIPEQYNALQTGVIEGTVLPLDNLDMGKYTEIAKNATMINLGSTWIGFWAMNKDSFNRLSKADQRLLIEKAEEASTEEAEYLATTLQPEILKRWTDAGVKIHYFTDAQKREWAGLLEEDGLTALAKVMEANGLPGKQFADDYMQLMKKHGHEFPY